MDKVTDVLTGIEYDLTHLANLVVPFYLMIAGQQVQVDLHVFYANHCYTRSRKDEPVEAVLFRERKRDETIDERVFCLERYKFSHQLPKILAELNQSICYRGSDNELFYRLTSDPKSRMKLQGWYICARLDASAKHHQLRLNVRSVHYRTNEPHGVRGTCRFFKILEPFYLAQKAKYPWV